MDPVLSEGVLAALPRDVLDRLLVGSRPIEVPPGTVLYREGDTPRCGVLLAGLMRVFLAGLDGRQVTIRYMRPGSLSGSSLMVTGAPAGVCVQAVTAIRGLMLDVAGVRALAQSDARVAWALAREVAHSQEEIMRAFGVTAFGTVRQRLARHLLDMAAERQAGARLVAQVSQQELADAVGTAREVVARTLRELRDAGIVRTGRGGVELLDPSRLHATVEPE